MQSVGRARTAAVALLVSAFGCDDHSEAELRAAAAASASAAAALKAASKPVEAPPGGCVARSDKPVELGQTQGTLHGLVMDATHLFYTTWQVYGGRGDVATIRKDGKGISNLISVALEPRDLAVDATQIYYTEGIRLKKISKSGEKPETVDDNFSSQAIAHYGQFIFGVPGDYGPYDRLVRQPTQGGASKELDTATRPELKEGPAGFNDIEVDATGVYVADSGKGRILQFQNDRAKPKVLAAGQPHAYSLALAGELLYFTLALKGDVLVMTTSGAKPKKIGGGLVKQATIAADSGGVVVPLAGEADDSPIRLALISADGGEPMELTVLPPSTTVEALALDTQCLYWAQRETGSGKLKIMALAK